MKKQTLALIILSILLVSLLGYVAFDKYSEFKQEEQLGIFQQGVQYGYEQAIIYLMNQASTCQPVPVYYENTTINLIAVECLS